MAIPILACPQTVPQPAKPVHHGTAVLQFKVGRNRKTEYRFKLWERHPYCRFCGVQLAWRRTTLDHLLPVSRGGKDIPANLVLCCARCNQAKGDRTLREWAIDILCGAPARKGGAE